MKIISYIFTLMLLFGAVDSLVAQSGYNHILILDLAEIDPGGEKSIQGNSTYDAILIKNSIIGKAYNLIVSREMQVFPSLPFKNSGLQAMAPDSANCTLLRTKYDDLVQLFDRDNNKSAKVNEKKVSETILLLEAELLNSTCKNSQLKDSANALISRCQKLIPEKIKVASGETVTITITREDKVWTWELKGDKIGEWLMSYGFGFCSSALAGKTYHLQQMDDTTTFKVTKDARPGALDLAYIPAIFYSFLPASKYNNSYNWSITAGLGFDLSAPVVFFGGGFMFRQNIGINMGIAFQQQSKLYPQYYEGQILTSSIQDSQLHDKVYRPNLFISINFRFDKSKNTEIQDAMKSK